MATDNHDNLVAAAVVNPSPSGSVAQMVKKRTRLQATATVDFLNSQKTIALIMMFSTLKSQPTLWCQKKTSYHDFPSEKSSGA